MYSKTLSRSHRLPDGVTITPPAPRIRHSAQVLFAIVPCGWSLHRERPSPPPPRFVQCSRSISTSRRIRRGRRDVTPCPDVRHDPTIRPNDSGRRSPDRQRCPRIDKPPDIPLAAWAISLRAVGWPPLFPALTHADETISPRCESPRGNASKKRRRRDSSVLFCAGPRRAGVNRVDLEVLGTASAFLRLSIRQRNVLGGRGNRPLYRTVDRVPGTTRSGRCARRRIKLSGGTDFRQGMRARLTPSRGAGYRFLAIKKPVRRIGGAIPTLSLVAAFDRPALGRLPATS